jgi:serine/threonine protein kinase
MYAMKIVQLAGLTKEHDRQSAFNEVRFLVSIDHPNITKMEDTIYNEEDDTLMLVQEFATRGDVRQNIVKMLEKTRATGYT